MSNPKNNLTLKRHGYAIMSQGVLGVDISRPSCCLSAERQKDCTECHLQVIHPGRGWGRVYWSLKSAIIGYVWVISAQLHHSFLT